VNILVYLNLNNHEINTIKQIYRGSEDQVVILDDASENLKEKLLEIAAQHESADLKLTSGWNQIDNERGPESLNLSIIDDNQITRSFLKKYLTEQRWGCPAQVTAFREGQSFFEKQQLEKPGRHIVLLENILPRMTGLEIVERIRRTYSDDQVAIMMFSGRNRENDIINAFKFGVNDYMEKPIKTKELVLRVMNMAKRMDRYADALS
jgi:Response regulators consisting of a CheY-like receiver domain and a winged-helix DNA-binding domain